MKTLILTLLLASSMAHATRLVVEAKRPLSEKEMKNKPFKVEAFYKTSHPYFSRLYVVSGNVDEKALTKLSWVKKVEPTLELTKLSLLPGENPQMLVSDELFPYQWGLLNQGQTYILEKDDIHNIPMKGIDNKDIGWKDLYQITNKTCLLY